MIWQIMYVLVSVACLFSVHLKWKKTYAQERLRRIKWCGVALQLQRIAEGVPDELTQQIERLKQSDT